MKTLSIPVSWLLSTPISHPPPKEKNKKKCTIPNLFLHCYCSQIISLYPHYLPSSVNFTRSVPPLHEIADINQLSRSNEETKLAYKVFLREFLEDIRGTSITHGYKLVSHNLSFL